MTLQSSPPTVASSWDRVVSIVLLALLPVVALASSFFAIVSVMGAAVCRQNDCDSGIINAGGFIAGFVPWLILVAASVIVITALVRRGRAFWYAISAFVLAVAAGLGGVLVIFSEILGQSTT